MIECKECGRKYSNMLTWKHLRKCCGMSTAEYKEKYGEYSLVSTEYRKLLSERGLVGAQAPSRMDAASKMMKARWAEPGYAERQIALAQTPEAIAKRSAALRKVYEDPKMLELRREIANRKEVKAKISAASKGMWQDPGVRPRLLKHNQELRQVAIDNWKDPDLRERMTPDPKAASERMRALFSDPVWKAKQHTAMNKGLARACKRSKIHREFKEAMDNAGILGFMSEQVIVPRTRCDEANRELGVVVEVNGCYWHGCRACYPDGKPFDRERVRAGIERYNAKIDRLISLGWEVVEVWEHEIRADMGRCVERVRRAINTANFSAIET